MSITVNFTYSVSGKTVKFTDTTQSSAAIAYRKWTFGDGSESSSKTPSHTYSSYGKTYTVKLEVMNTSADVKTVTKTIRTGSSGGGGGGGTTCSTTAKFTYSVSGKTIRFTDTSTSSGSGCSISRRLWNLGSGMASENRTCSRTFPNYNTSYPIILTVTDSKGNKKSTSKTVRTGAAPSATTFDVYITAPTGASISVRKV